ncbi:sigma 54-interacting transcriptional regulator [Fluviispira sanaruensis]|uniref:Nitrogen fixation specific regulatory protein NifA n=1 Tax=Fluviispira sanaruensis TaxID=2493639 RepID=A0A4P2VI71_FLUSA|nr:sigma 54-interacting transcriptional regulator [Fluviispira sanaruensis]BBH52088.1 nitrogen fixation specific regulatory protein NifA [Fluviispira sanaruensis]
MIEESDINFEDFEKLNIINKLRQIIGSWWNIQLNFTDEKGVLKGVPQGKFFNAKNPICKLITESDKTFPDCVDIASKTTIESEEAEAYLLSTCHAGFSTMSLPLKLGKKYLGCIFADGFLIEETVDEQKDRLRMYLKKHFNGNTKELEDYIAKLPVLSLKEVSYLKELLEVVLDEILNLRKTISDNTESFHALSNNFKTQWTFENIVGKSQAMQNVFKLLVKIKESEATILITGENGTGKEGIAKSIHVNSKRKNENFIVQNCGAINDNLLETELFGHVKGAFTNAIKDKKGLFELADKGTLFLDEIGDTSPSMQVKLLRVLQEGTFLPVGGSEQKKVDVRILAATNRNLEQMVKEGTFREDLYYRLNVINVKLPPLRERKEDIPILISKFLSDYSKLNNVNIKKINSSCIYKMEKYDWPGNVRELQNEVERLCVLSGDEKEIKDDLLSDRIYGVHEKEDIFKTINTSGTLKDAVENLEKTMILTFLENENWNKSRAAKKLGISRASLIMKCEKYNFERVRKES